MTEPFRNLRASTGAPSNPAFGVSPRLPPARSGQEQTSVAERPSVPGARVARIMRRRPESAIKMRTRRSPVCLVGADDPTDGGGTSDAKPSLGTEVDHGRSRLHP